MKRPMIIGTGSYVPDRVLSNLDLEKMVETSDQWIRERTGIVERRMAEKDVYTSDLALPASLKAMEMAGITASDLDLILVATITPDTQCPAAACWLQYKLNAKQAPAFDVGAACSGFVFGLSVAEQYLKAGTAKTVLMVAAEIMTRTLNYKDRNTCILWGDGAGAVVMQMIDDDRRGILSTHLHSDGAGGTKLQLPGGGSMTTPISYESVDKDLHTLKMNGPDSFKIAVRAFSDVSIEALEHNGYTINDLDLLIPHQANLRIIEAVAKRVKLPMEKVYITIYKYGNISSASIAIALDEAVRSAAIKPDNLVLFSAFGGGLSWGSSLVRW